MSLDAKPLHQGTDDLPATTAGVPITSTFLMGRAETVPDAVGDQDACVLSCDPANRALRVTDVGGGGAPGFGQTAVHVSFTDADLAGGASTVTFYTITAARFAELHSVVASYTGTVAGVTLQLVVGGVIVDLPVGGLSSGIFVRLLPAGIVIPANATETLQITVTGATATDDLNVRAHLVEMTT